jgi:hypothetical protein
VGEYHPVEHTEAFIELQGCNRVPYSTPLSSPEPYRRWLESRTPDIRRTEFGGWQCKADCWRHCSGNDLSAEGAIRRGELRLKPQQVSMFSEFEV